MRLLSSLPILCIPLLAYSTVVEAQSTPNAFELEYTYSSPSEGDFEDEITLHEGKAGVLFTLSDIKDNRFGFAVGGNFQANVWDPDNSRLDEVDLYKVRVPVITEFKATDSFVLGLNVTPGVHSDFEEVDEDDFRVDGSLSGRYIWSPTLQIVLGAAVGEEFGDVEAYPIGGFRWQANDALLLDIIIPRPRVQYAFTEGFQVFAFGEPSGGEWNVGDSDETQVDIQQKGYRVGAGLEIGVGEKGWLYFAGGVEAGRELQIALDENEVFDDEVDLDDQAFVRAGFRIAR